MTNYIEIQHAYIDRDGDTCVDTRWAVNPSPDEWTHADGTKANWTHLAGSPWQIEPGRVLEVYAQSDIDSLRKLLDAIEEQLKEEA